MNDVNVVIQVAKASAKAGFGYPLILAGKQTSAVAYRECSSLTEIESAGFAATTDIYKAAELLFMQNDAPSKVAVCASEDTSATALAGLLEEDWRQLIVVSTGEEDSTVEQIATVIEGTRDKMYFTHVGSTAASTTATSLSGKERTVCIVYDVDEAGTDTKFPEAALVGATAGLGIGSFTYKNIILNGVLPQAFTDAQVTGDSGFHKLGLITILKKAGDIVTSEGIVVSKEYIDIIDSKDYIINQIEYQTQSLLNRVPKLAYDNNGIASLEGVVLSVLTDAAALGMIAQLGDGVYDYSVTFAPRNECQEADISNREYKEGKFSFTLAGAIHTGTIYGTIVA